MTSINTNIAAQTALRTLQATNNALDTTQSRISTGLKIGEAKDNAAYWSISTALKSDNKALGTVGDALGLGAATVDVAYQGLNNAKDVLDEIKSKLTAATQAGVDRNVIQAEIAELQAQLKSIAASSVFSGENWLSTDSAADGYTDLKQVVASFTRGTGNTVSIGTVDIDISEVALFDASAEADAAGILDGQVALKKSDGTELKIGGTNAVGNATLTGGLPASATTGEGDAEVVATAGRLTSALFTISGSGLADGDDLKFSITIDGGSVQNFTINIADATTFDIDDVVAGMSALTGATVAAGTGADAGKLVITSSSTGEDSTVAISGVMVAADGQNTAKANTATSLSAGNVIVDGEDATDATAGSVETGAFALFTLDADDTISFDIAVDGDDAVTITIDRALIDETLGEDVEGEVADLEAYQLVVAAALAAADVDGVTVAVNDDEDALVFTSATEGAASSVAISEVAASSGADTISVETIDISDAALTAAGASTGAQIRDVLGAYVSVVNAAIAKVTTAASNLGAVASRIELQQSFVANLRDTIDAGISGLIDADMNEESTRLQALQVKQQLGVQALAIANQSAQNVLRLFQ